MTEENDIVEITAENGETYKVEVIDIFTLDNIEYALLSPIDGCNCEEDECECDEDDYVLMRLVRDGEDYSFEMIEDDEEFEKVAAYIDEMADEAE